MAAMNFNLVPGGGCLEAFWLAAEGHFGLVLRETLRPGAVTLPGIQIQGEILR